MVDSERPLFWRNLILDGRGDDCTLGSDRKRRATVRSSSSSCFPTPSPSLSPLVSPASSSALCSVSLELLELASCDSTAGVASG